jgi:hypothetical protein
MTNTDLLTYSLPQTYTFPYPVSHSYTFFQSSVSGLYIFPALFIIIIIILTTITSSTTTTTITTATIIIITTTTTTIIIIIIMAGATLAAV